MHDVFDASGVFSVCCTGADGKKKWEFDTPNLVCVGGGNLLLDAGFSNADPGDESFCGLISDADFTVISRSDTMTVRQWIESNCSGTKRPTISWQSATTATKRFATPVVFNVTAADTVSGIFIVYGATGSSAVFDEAGVLWSAAEFINSSQAVVPGDSISIQYLVSLFKLGTASPLVTVSEAVTAFSAQDAFISSTAVKDEITATQSSEVVMNWARTGIDSLLADENSFAFVTQLVPDEFISFRLESLVANDFSTAHIVQDVTTTNSESLLADEVSESVVVTSSPDSFNVVRLDLSIAQDKATVHVVQTIVASASDSIRAAEVSFALVGPTDFSTFVIDIFNAREQSDAHIVTHQLASASDSLTADEIAESIIIPSDPSMFDTFRIDVLIATDKSTVHLVDSITTTANDSLAAGVVSFVTVTSTTPKTFDVFRLDLSLAQDIPAVQVIRHLTRADQLTATSAAISSLTTANQQRTDLLIATINQSALITRFASRSDSLLASFIEHSDAVLADFGARSDQLTATNSQTATYKRAGIVLELQGHDLIDSSVSVYKRGVILIEAATAADAVNAVVSSPGNWFDFVVEPASAADAIIVAVTKVDAIVEAGSAGTFQFIDPWFLVDQAGNFVIDVDGNLVIAPGTGP